ncbi:MAG: hypothetical protein CMK83_04645 [Pseudomonadales bacterium]|jgi:hypothetical protein|nr:hypothetical protein [Pseudomonadales bacterium]MCK5791429.1 DUF4124 domain-containing protein [Ketobacter sp.]MEC8813365.1 DUF4124 domain-containing protein [Pseudomonadota bacterium]TNC89308.1 MAG: hypothetical protein CSH49_07915 [Alcanivorax sp.]HAG96823.1 hypothetical protein [Gammaproteobacteria bacterium]
MRLWPMECLKSVVIGLGMLFAASAQAEVYRWVDESGKVHFSDRAPDQGAVEKIDLPQAEEPAPSRDLSDFERLQRQKKLVKMLEEERLAKEAQQAQLAREAEEHAQYCTRFKNRLGYIDQYTHFYDEKEDGTREYMSEDQADAYRARLKQQYKEECGEA